MSPIDPRDVRDKRISFRPGSPESRPIQVVGSAKLSPHSDGGRLRAQRGRRTGPAVFSHSDGARTRFTAATLAGGPHQLPAPAGCYGRGALREVRLVPVQARPWSPPGCTRGQRTGTPKGVPVLAGSACSGCDPVYPGTRRSVINDISRCRCLTGSSGTVDPGGLCG